MKLYKCDYQDITKQGTKYIFAKNIMEAKQKLHNKSLLPISIKEISIFTQLNSKTYELENIFWQLGFGYNSGLNLIVILESIKEGLYHKENIALLDSMIDSLQQGESLSYAIKQHRKLCGNLILSLFEIGEKSGYLSETCELCAKEIKQKNDFIDSLRKALIYPSILAIAFLCVFIILSLFVIPEFAQIYKELDSTLPQSTQCIIQISNFFNAYFIEFFACVIGGFLLFLKSLQNKKIKDKIMINMPILRKIVIDYEMYRYFLGLHYFLKSQVSFEESVQTCTNLLDNIYLKNQLSCIVHLLHSGIPLSEALQEIDINIANIALLRSGEKSGSLDKSLLLNAEFYKKSYQHSLQTLNLLVEPIATIIMGLFVTWLAFSVVSPMWQLLEIAI